MPFLAPLIAPVLGLGALGSAVLQVGLAVGLSFAASKLRPKQKQGVSGASVGLTMDPNAPREVIIGETATGGSLVFWHLSGPDKDKLWLVIALADHECNSLQGVIVDKKLKAWNSSTGEVADYGANLKVRFYNGTMTQTADTALIAASDGRWTSNERGLGVCHVVVEALYDEKLFPSGIPEMGFIVRGASLTDPRTGLQSYSDNSASAVYQALKGFSVGGEPLLGMNVPDASIRIAEGQSAANACDEAVPLAAGGTEKRYRCGCVLNTTMSNRDIIETLLASMAGEVIESGGIYRIIAGVAQTPVMSITDDDLVSGETLAYRPKKSRNAIVNAVNGSFVDPSRNYTSIALPPRTSSLDEAADGGIRLSSTVDLASVTSRSQGQRVLEILRRKARRMGELDAQTRPGLFVLEPGDWVSYTSVRRGFTNKVFQIEGVNGGNDLRTDVSLSEIDDAFDDWNTSLELSDDQVADLAPGGPSSSTITGIDLDAIIVTGVGSEQRPGLHITWTPVTDSTVINIALEYRKPGDTVALERTILNPLEGKYSWMDGVQGGVTYEARLRPITRPERTTNWSTWYSSASAAPPQIVSVAAYAETVNPANLPPAILSAQERLELYLALTKDAIQGSAQERIDEVIEELQRQSSASIEHRFGTNEVRSRVLISERTIQEVAQSFAEYKVEVDSVLNDPVTGLPSIATATQTLQTNITTANGRIDDVEARATIAVNVNNQVVGVIDLAGNALASQITLLSDKLLVAKPNGSGAKQILTTGTVDGVGDVVVINADVALPDNAIKAKHIDVVSIDAISGDFGIITAGMIRSVDNTFKIDVTNKTIDITF